jgi:hypothetical protein
MIIFFFLCLASKVITDEPSVNAIFKSALKILATDKHAAAEAEPSRLVGAQDSGQSDSTSTNRQHYCIRSKLSM